ncbi:MAG: hypothetical protein AAGF07_00340 [Patescibacteria group bacterium]
MPKKEFLQFNFTEPVNESKSMNEFLEAKKNSVRRSLKNNQNKTNYAWIVVFILLLSLFFLAGYSYYRNLESEKQIDSLKTQTNTQQLNQDDVQNIVTGDNFSLVLNRPTPANFRLERNVTESQFLEDLTTVKTNFTSSNVKDGQELISGIEVQISEYDNKLDKSLFEETVLTKLDTGYEIVTRDVILPKNTKVTQIQRKDMTEDEVYYITVTEDNYYIIKVYNQAARYPEFEETTEFTESLLPSLYLN